MPSEWSVESLQSKDECALLDGNYLNLGIGKVDNNASLTETRLDAALGHAYPTARMPHSIVISINKNASSIDFEFGNPVNEVFSMETICRDGWYEIMQSQGSEYDGDGTTLDFENRKILLGKSADGDMLVHLELEAQFSSLSVVRATEKREIWSRYQKIDREAE